MTADDGTSVVIASTATSRMGTTFVDVHTPLVNTAKWCHQRRWGRGHTGSPVISVFREISAINARLFYTNSF